MTTQLRETTLELCDRLTAMGVSLPLALKRRDPKEPGRREKEKTEEAIQKAFIAYFRQQKKAIREKLTMMAVGRKAMTDGDLEYYMAEFGDDFWNNPEFIARLGRILTAATSTGLDIFAEMIALQIDYTLVNEAAAKWALKYAGEKVKEIDANTLSRLRTEMSNFVSMPGRTIGDIMSALPYKESRARLIAIDQTTSVYANAELLAGEALQKEYPDVEVVKRWFTNNDTWFDASGRRHGVCEICQPLHMQVRPLNEPFVGGDGSLHDKPGAHIGCRCFLSITTRINANA